MLRGFWAPLVLCALAAVSRTHACPTENGICHFGTLPGGWISSKGRALLPWQDDEELANMNFSVWQPYCSTCQLQPLLSPYLEGGNILPEDPRAAKLRPLSILLFGDSVDFRIVKFFCNLALDLEPEDFGFPGVEDRLKLQGICRTPKLTLAKYHISSVSFEGPYWNGINFPPLQSIQDGLDFWQKAHGSAPDIVMLSSNFWDISKAFADGGFQFKGTVLENELFPDEWMHSWIQNFTTILTQLKESVPEGTMLAYHTLHTPHQTKEPQFWETDAFLRQHVAQINAAGRFVAAQQHYHLLDIEAMALQLSKSTILIDQTHPGPDFMMQVLNILLNMEETHRKVRKEVREQGSMRGWVRWQRERFTGTGYFSGRRLFRV
ncbi:hypothetical protein WJX75_008757 [Coccomyxa subellipsoidea]|uniref:SGNH hydrolase-type esterase domain-containing protein n=1 Tax=Coccomyxa subellipsoidea TaxID=248742 RepID=A0ABR2YSH3_9CHLO